MVSRPQGDRSSDGVLTVLLSPPEGSATAQRELLRGARQSRLTGVASLGRERLLWSWFTRGDVPNSLPVAPVALLGEGLPPGTECWVRVEPVGMVADWNRVVWANASHLMIRAEEAEQFCRRLREALPEALGGLRPVAPGRWYAPVDAIFPRCDDESSDLGESWGAAGGRLPPIAALTTECEMVLHSAPENDRRESRGEPRVNGVRFSGRGYLPTLASLPESAVVGDDPLLLGLAQLTGAVRFPDATAVDAAFHQARRGLLLLESGPSGESSDSSHLMERLHRDALEPLHRGCWSRVDVIVPDSTGATLFQYKPRWWRRWWRRW